MKNDPSMKGGLLLWALMVVMLGGPLMVASLVIKPPLSAEQQTAAIAR